MTDTAYKIWETFKAELIVEPTDDMKKALGNAIRVISSTIHRSGILEDEPWLTHIADELNCISYDVEAL
jgi:hypothetical protein